MALKIDAALASKPQITTQAIKAPAKDFKEVLEQAPKSKDIFQDIQEIQKNLVEGKPFSGRDLILYQIKTGHFGLRVELISKLAEAAIGTVKKFQNQQ